MVFELKDGEQVPLSGAQPASPIPSEAYLLRFVRSRIRSESRPTTHGGKRPGAGRKPGARPPMKPRIVHLSQDAEADLSTLQERLEASASAVVRRALHELAEATEKS